MIDASEIARKAAGDCYKTWGTCHRSAAELREMWASIIEASMQPLVEERDTLAAEVADFLKAAAESGYTSRSEDAFRQVAQAVVSDAGSAKVLAAELRSSREIQAAAEQILIAEIEKNCRLAAAAGAMQEALRDLECASSEIRAFGWSSNRGYELRDAAIKARVALLPAAGAALLAQMAALRAVIEQRIDTCRQFWPWNHEHWDTREDCLMPTPHDEGCDACRDLREAVTPTAGAAVLARLSSLVEGIAWAYQLAGAVEAPEWALNNLSALAHGEPVPHEWQAATSGLLERLEKQSGVIVAYENAVAGLCQLTGTQMVATGLGMLPNLEARINERLVRLAKAEADSKRLQAFRVAAETYILRLRQIVYSGVDSIKVQAGIEITAVDLAGKLQEARAAIDAAIATKETPDAQKG